VTSEGGRVILRNIPWKQISIFFLIAVFFSLELPGDLAAQETQKQEQYLKQILRVLPPLFPGRGRVSPLDSTWRDWLERTGELPPDFSAMPSRPFLPDPLVLEENGKQIPITNSEQWEQKREWMRRELQHWETGTFPPPPENMQARVLEETKDGEVIIRTVELRFGSGHRAKMTAQLMIPPGEGPFPVFLTQWNHRGWAQIAVRRGYIGCIYAGADGHDDSDTFADVWYPGYDFTQLMRRAWGGSRVVDYLYTLPMVDKEKIGLTGHSRNGKQSLMAAAFDERIDAVIPSSGGTGGEIPFRYTSKKYDIEDISIITGVPNWMHPRMRFFVGREQKLPVDQNLFMALIAPRGLMLSDAVTETYANPWGIERTYWSARKVYQFLGAPNNIGIRMRYGRHGTIAEDIEAYVDFFDYVFGRSSYKPKNKFFYDYSFSDWTQKSGESIDPLQYPQRGIDDLLENRNDNPITSVEAWEEKKARLQQVVRWGLGEEPPGVTNPGPEALQNRRRSGSSDWGKIIGRPDSPRMGRMVVGPYHSFGDYLYGDLYYPIDKQGAMRQGPFPVVMFLHEYSYGSGYAKNIEPLVEDLVAHGFAVFSYDMIGFGSRFEEGARFYDRYPKWSKMGKMVADARGALEALSNMTFVDKDQIYVVGYSLGATVGLYTAALDNRVRGMASVCGFTPMRLDTPDKGTEGIRAYSHLHGLLPRLGFFVGEEARIPYDFHELLGSIAPRPLFVLSPSWDRDATLEDVVHCVDQVRKVYGLYGAESHLSQWIPDDYNRFSRAMQRKVVEWVSGQMSH